MPQEESVLRLGRDEALEAARLWQECGDAREFACRMLGSVMNAPRWTPRPSRCAARAASGAQRRQENSLQRLPPQVAEDRRGDVELEIPKLRHGTYYPEGMLARWSRVVDTSVAAIVQEMYVCGVSTPQGRARGVQAGAYPRCRASEVSSLCSDPRRRGGGVPPPRPSGTPCVATRGSTPPT
ncbi:MAG: transposase [Collinsella sp.]